MSVGYISSNVQCTMVVSQHARDTGGRQEGWGECLREDNEDDFAFGALVTSCS